MEFTNDTVTMDERSCVHRSFVHLAKFASFVMLKFVVCIGSYCVKNVFSVRSLEGMWWTGDVDVCSNCGVRAEAGGGWEQ